MGILVRPRCSLLCASSIGCSVVATGASTESRYRKMTVPTAEAVNLYLLLLLATLPLQTFAFTPPQTRSNAAAARSALFRSSAALPRSSRAAAAASESNTADQPTEHQQQQSFDYNWKEQWYALTYASYVPSPSKSAEVTPAAVFGEPLVLWREVDDGPIYCASDQCPHRASALSEGRLRNGNIECLYHGWQFSGDKGGDCQFIPQLEENAAIPKRACLDMKQCRVVEGIVWVWMADTEPKLDPPSAGILDEDGKSLDKDEGWNVYDFQIDLPYDHSYLVENLIDPAHIPISHDKTPGGGKRENAAAYEMIVDDDSIGPRGFTGRFKLVTQPEDRPYTELKFEAPGIIRQMATLPLKNDKEMSFAAALHCMPLGLGRSRLLFRTMIRGLPLPLKIIIGSKPIWLRHLNSCKVLEQDVGLITTQEDHFNRNPDNTLEKDYLLLKSSDVYVGAYRKWMDRAGKGMPWFQGLATIDGNVYSHVPASTLPPALTPAYHRGGNQPVVETRYHRHVMHSPVTRAALRNVKRIKKLFAASAGAALLTCSALAPTLVQQQDVSLKIIRIFKAAVALLFSSGAITTGMHLLEREFYVSFKRKDELRGESGLAP